MTPVRPFAAASLLVFAASTLPSVVSHPFHRSDSPINPNRVLPSAHPPRLAVVRPFCTSDASALPRSFDSWDEFPPCDARKSLGLKADLFLVFSQYVDESPPAKHAIESVLKAFQRRGGWGECFNSLVPIGVEVRPDLDLYRPDEQGTNVLWVNGPNRVFERSVREVQSSKWGAYETMYLMEGDSVPARSHWLDTLADDIERQRPFAILGSKYRGDKWDPFYDELPTALVNHINGNAIYNVTHPLLDAVVTELEREADTPWNSIPYDYRIAQMLDEGSRGVVPKLPSKFLLETGGDDGGTVGMTALPSKTEKFASWVQEFVSDAGSNDGGPIKETQAIANYAATNMLPHQVGDEAIVHGASMYAPWDANQNWVTLVVSDWDDSNSKHLLSTLKDSSSHPFSDVVVMLPRNGNDNDHGPLVSYYDEGAKVRVAIRRRDASSPDYMDICSAPISTPWFVITNSYHRVHPKFQLMVDPTHGGIPVVPFAPATRDFCYKFPSCAKTMELAKEINPEIDVIVRDFDMVFATSERDAFCDMWKDKYGPDGRGGDAVPTATAYVAYLQSRSGRTSEDIYAFTDRSLYGNRENFVPVPSLSRPASGDELETSSSAKRRNLLLVAENGDGDDRSSTAGTNVTGCQLRLTEEECVDANDDDDNGLGGTKCLWRPLFESCHPLNHQADAVTVPIASFGVTLSFPPTVTANSIGIDALRDVTGDFLYSFFSLHLNSNLNSTGNNNATVMVTGVELILTSFNVGMSYGSRSGGRIRKLERSNSFAAVATIVTAVFEGYAAFSPSTDSTTLPNVTSLAELQEAALEDKESLEIYLEELRTSPSSSVEGDGLAVLEKLEAANVFPVTVAPSLAPTSRPSRLPSLAPSSAPTGPPTASPTFAPSSSPTFEPSLVPTNAVTTSAPSAALTDAVTTLAPSRTPSSPPRTPSPSPSPTDAPPKSSPPSPSPVGAFSQVPSLRPSLPPTGAPTPAPSVAPSGGITRLPTSPPSKSVNEGKLRGPPDGNNGSGTGTTEGGGKRNVGLIVGVTSAGVVLVGIVAMAVYKVYGSGSTTLSAERGGVSSTVLLDQNQQMQRMMMQQMDDDVASAREFHY